MKRLIPILFVIAVATFVIALSTGGNAKTHKNTQTAAAISVRPTALGKILVDANGRTLYLFEADKPNKSNCKGACLSIWPAVAAGGQPQAGAGAVASRIGTIAASGGKRQVTYNSHPLYYYAGDKKPGDTTGQGLDQFGAKWYVLSATGEKVDND